MKTPKNSVLVLFGATGNLAKQKLFPALFMLHRHKRVPKKFMIIGTGRKPFTDKTFRAYVKKSLTNGLKSKKLNPRELDAFVARLHYAPTDIMNQEDYHRLSSEVDTISKHAGKCNLILYLAVEPNLFGEVVPRLEHSGLVKRNRIRRIVIEKPFGYDYKSAKRLNGLLQSKFKQDDIYHIDHYLGKELVQNILVMRFANTIFEKIWNSDFIDHVQITASEKAGVEGRVNYYEKSGALRDVMQNHLLQILAFVAMEPPKNLEAIEIRKNKVEIFRCIRHTKKIIAVRGQYSSGKIDGEKVQSYAQELGRRSSTETYAALKLFVKNPRWKGVPFYLRTGKRLEKSFAEVNIVFKHALSFKLPGKEVKPNVLTISIQPYEGIKIHFNTKLPGIGLPLPEIGKQIEPVEMDFCHSCLFAPKTPEAYERLFYDILVGDRTLFVSWDEIRYAWKFIDKIEKAWTRKPKFPNYKAGSRGPKEAEKLIERDGRKWLDPKDPRYIV